MDRHVDCPTSLINNFNHLLIALSTARCLQVIRYRHTNKSTEFTYTMINMDHIVAYLKLLNFLECQGSLATTGFI